MAETQKHTIALVSAVLVTVSLFCFLAYQRAFILQDYIVIGEASCDAATESCFVYECDPVFEECTGDPEQDIWYYKQVEKLARNISPCNPSLGEGCLELSCEDGEENCEEIYCDPSVEENICTETEEGAVEEGDQSETEESPIEEDAGESEGQASEEGENTVPDGSGNITGAEIIQ